MASIKDLPDNLNSAIGNRFRLQFGRLPGLQYWCQSVTIPDIILGEVFQETSLSVIKQPGDKITYSPLIFGFIVDEDLSNYKGIQEWIVGIGFPDAHNQSGTYTSSVRDGLNTERSDASIFIMSSAQNPAIEIKFKDVVPVSLGALNFDTALGAEPMQTDATFNFIGSFSIVNL